MAVSSVLLDAIGSAVQDGGAIGAGVLGLVIAVSLSKHMRRTVKADDVEKGLVIDERDPELLGNVREYLADRAAQADNAESDGTYEHFYRNREAFEEIGEFLKTGRHEYHDGEAANEDTYAASTSTEAGADAAAGPVAANDEVYARPGEVIGTPSSSAESEPPEASETEPEMRSFSGLDWDVKDDPSNRDYEDEGYGPQVESSDPDKYARAQSASFGDPELQAWARMSEEEREQWLQSQRTHS